MPPIRIPLRALAALAIICLAASCAGRDSAGSARTGEVFSFRIPGDPPSLDPVQSADLVSQAVVNNLFEQLVRLDPATGEVVPGVARSWEVSDDGLSFRFRLRDDVLFHNGRRLVADDVRYSFERLLDPASAAVRPWILMPLEGAPGFNRGSAGTVSGIETVGDTVVVLRLREPFAPFLVQLTMVGASICPREVIERSGEDAFARSPVGSGPFSFIEWRHDSRIVLERFDGYRRLTPGGVERAEFEVVPNISVALEKYRAGELDLLDQLPPGQIELVRHRSPDQLHIWPGLSVRYFGFNLTRPPFRDNRRLRQALNYAMNKTAVVEVLGEGVDVVSTGAVPPALPGHNPDLEGYPWDPDKARRLLAEAGYPGGRGLGEISLLYNNDPVDRRICEFAQACLAEVGVNIRLKSLEWAAFLSAVRAGEADIFRGSWVGDFPDAHNFLHTLFHSGNWGDAGNYTRFSDPVVDSLLTRSVRTVDMEERAALYRRVEEIISREAPWIFLFHPGQVAMLRPGWRGGEFPAVGVWAFPLPGVHWSP